MIYKHSIFNKKSINIFTDASLVNIDGHTDVCPGYCIYNGDIIIEQGFDILKSSTVNRGELSGILMGIYASIKYINNSSITNIRLYSDSQISIFGIRDRIFKWIKNSDNGNIITSSGNPVTNIDIIMEIINTILTYNIHIELYHVKGHMNYTRRKDIERAKDVFSKSNNIDRSILSDDLIQQICIGNDVVDKYTGKMLDLHNSNYTQVLNLLSIRYNKFDTDMYKSLIRR